MIKLISIIAIFMALIFNSFKVIDFINTREKAEEIIKDSGITRYIISTLTTLFVVCLFLKFSISYIFFKYFVLILFLMIIGYIDFFTKNVYSFILKIGLVIGAAFVVYELFSGVSITNYLISFIGTSIITLLFSAFHLMGWGDFYVFILCALFLGSLSFIPIFNIFLAFSLSGLEAIYLLVRYKFKVNINFKMALCPYIFISTFIILFVY